MKQERDIPTEAEDGTVAPPFAASASPPRPVLTFDVALYQHYLDDSGLSEEQKRDFLEVLWSLMVSFVDLGFGIDPVGLACGQNEESSCDPSGPAGTMTSAREVQKQNNNQPADRRNGLAERKEI